MIFWQYSRRQTMAARLTLACSIFVIAPGLSAIPDSKESTSEPKDQKVDVSGVRVSYDLVRMPSGIDTNRFGLGTATLLLPLQVSGLPPETALVDRRDEVVIGADDKSFLAGTVQRKGDDYYQSVYLTPAKLQAVKSHLSMRVKMHLTVVTDRVTRKAPAGQRPIAVSGLGFCEAYIRTCRQTVSTYGRAVKAPTPGICRRAFVSRYTPSANSSIRLSHKAICAVASSIWLSSG